MKQYADSIKSILWFLVILMLVITCIHSTSAGEIDVDVASSFNPVGSGARAIGMGGAFIAIADDATAASWNPGGLTQLSFPEISFAGNAFHRIEDNEFGNHTESSGNETVSKINVNFFSVAYPFQFWERNMIISLNYQHLYDFTRKWDFSLYLEGTSTKKKCAI